MSESVLPMFSSRSFIVSGRKGRGCGTTRGSQAGGWRPRGALDTSEEMVGGWKESPEFSALPGEVSPFQPYRPSEVT